MRGRPRIYEPEAIPLTEYERAKEASIAWSSRTLLERMLTVGAKSGGCLDLSAAQCRARLEMIA